MVLLAALAIAIALVPMLLAYMQLGYHPDVADPDPEYTRDVERTLERELVEATAGIPARYDWGARDAAVTDVKDRLESTIEALNRSALERRTVIQVSFNESLAAASAADHCPSGPRRHFGSCAAIGGVVVQERAGETHVLAIGFDVRLTADDRSTQVHLLETAP